MQWWEGRCAWGWSIPGALVGFQEEYHPPTSLPILAFSWLAKWGGRGHCPAAGTLLEFCEGFHHGRRAPAKCIPSVSLGGMLGSRDSCAADARLLVLGQLCSHGRILPHQEGSWNRRISLLPLAVYSTSWLVGWVSSYAAAARLLELDRLVALGDVPPLSLHASCSTNRQENGRKQFCSRCKTPLISKPCCCSRIPLPPPTLLCIGPEECNKWELFSCRGNWEASHHKKMLPWALWQWLLFSSCQLPTDCLPTSQGGKTVN